MFRGYLDACRLRMEAQNDFVAIRYRNEVQCIFDAVIGSFAAMFVEPDLTAREKVLLGMAVVRRLYGRPS